LAKSSASPAIVSIVVVPAAMESLNISAGLSSRVALTIASLSELNWMSASGLSPSDILRIFSNAALYSTSSILKFIIGISRVIVFLCRASRAPISWSR